MFREQRVTLPCWLCLLYSLVNPLDFRFLGPRMTGGEVVAFIGIFLLLPSLGRINFKPLLLPFAILALYAIGVICSDLIYHNNYFELFYRGFAKPLFIIMIALFFYTCFSLAPRSILFYLYGIPLAILIYLIRPPKDEVLETATAYNLFVSQYGPVLLTWARFAGATLYSKSKLIAAIPFFALLPIMGLFGSRSDALLCFLAGSAFVAMAFLKDPRRPRMHLSFAKLSGVAAVVTIAISSFYVFYIYAAPSGLLGEMQKQKFTQQTQTRFGASPLGLLMSGRTEAVAMALAIKDSPVFGLGSWPVLTDYYYEAADYSGDSRAVKLLLASGGGGRSSGHSAILGSWTTVGFMGAIFWFYLAYVVYRIFLRLIRDETLLTAWYLPMIFFFYWHWAFSPIGTGARQGAGIFIAMYAAFFAASSIPSVRARFYRECRLPGKGPIHGRH